MANLPSIRDYITDIEVADDQPLTRALISKFGSNINYILDKEFTLQRYTSNQTIVVPSGVNTIFIAGIGGGGGGGGGSYAGNTGGGGTGGGGGGGGGAAGNRDVFLLPVTPGDSLVLTVGTGGPGGSGGVRTGQIAPTAGSSGNATYVTRAGRCIALFYGGNGGSAGGVPPGVGPGQTGGPGGFGGSHFLYGSSPGGEPQGFSFVPAGGSAPAYNLLQVGAGGGAGGRNTSSNGGPGGGNNGVSGGAGGSSPALGGGGGGGAGGQTIYGLGGAGGIGAGLTIPGAVGYSAGTGSNGANYGGGGGGGGGGYSLGDVTPSLDTGANGGAGAPGLIEIAYFVVP